MSPADRRSEDPVIYTGYLRLSIAAAALISFNLFGAGGVNVNFDNLKTGTFPPFWSAAATRPYDPSHWEIERDMSAPSRPNVFAQVSGVPRDVEFPMAIFDKVTARDGDVSVKFKIDQNARRTKAAGLVWRYQDPQNYYLLRFSVNEKSIALFRVQDGQLHPIPLLVGTPRRYSVSHDLRTGQWYVARVVFHGPYIQVFFGNRQLFDVEDHSLNKAGKTGLWTQGPTVASFDDFHVGRRS